MKGLNIENEEITYIAMTKRQISERFKELRDMKYNGRTTGLARSNIRAPIQTDSTIIEKITTVEPLLSETLLTETLD